MESYQLGQDSHLVDEEFLLDLVTGVSVDDFDRSFLTGDLMLAIIDLSKGT